MVSVRGERDILEILRFENAEEQENHERRYLLHSINVVSIGCCAQGVSVSRDIAEKPSYKLFLDICYNQPSTISGEQS